MRHDFERVPGNNARCDEEMIDKLLSQRTEAKRQSDFETADRIRDRLRRMEVEVFDRERMWWIIGGGGQRKYVATSHDYRKIGDGDCDEERVNRMLAERLQARITRDFRTADGLRNELRSMGVEVDDKVKTWEVRGGGGGYRDGGGGSRGGGGGPGRFVSDLGDDDVSMGDRRRFNEDMDEEPRDDE
tara:strand:- start:365 stop:925 length:561 start_codon:yes stop_codon:yes gene_type:complete